MPWLRASNQCHKQTRDTPKKGRNEENLSTKGY